MGVFLHERSHKLIKKGLTIILNRVNITHQVGGESDDNRGKRYSKYIVSS